MTTTTDADPAANDARLGAELAAAVPTLYDQYMDAVMARDTWLVTRDAQSWDVPAPDGVSKVHRAELGRSTKMGSQAITRAIRKARERLGLPLDPTTPPAGVDYIAPRSAGTVGANASVEQLTTQLLAKSRHQLARELAAALSARGAE